MRWVRFDDDRLGVLDGDEVIDVSWLVEDAFGLDRMLVGLRNRALDAPPSLSGDRFPLDRVTLLPPLRRPGKVIGAPVNYLDHKREMKETVSIAELGVFLKAPTSVIGPGASVELPYTDVPIEQEGELAVVIGRRARHVPPEQALDVVFGYTCLLDITVRSSEDRSTRKSFDTFTPLGPCVATRDEVGDPRDLQLRCWVNGQQRQATSISELIFDVPTLISYASSVMTLEPGDVIATGTPAGVGPLAAGDQVSVEIDRVGRLEVDVQATYAIPYGERPRATFGPA